MTEYIFDVPDSNQPIAGDTALYYPDERDDPMMVCEEIVRCRDCIYCYDDDSVWQCAKLGFGIDYITSDVKPDGFCAWGEKAE